MVGDNETEQHVIFFHQQHKSAGSGAVPEQVCILLERPVRCCGRLAFQLKQERNVVGSGCPDFHGFEVDGCGVADDGVPNI